MASGRGKTGGRRKPAGRVTARSGSAKRSWWRRAAPFLIPVGVIAAIVFVISRIDVGDAVREGLTLPLRHEDIIRQQAGEKDVDASLIAAVIYSESRFEDATSHAGARGLMQITPETAEMIATLSGGSAFITDDLSDPDINIRYGTFLLGYLLERFDGNEVAALAAYNAGASNADRWGGTAMIEKDIGFPETRAYVDQVLEKRREYRRHYAKELGL